MAAYYKVDVSLSANSVTVGMPSPQEVLVTLPLVGPQGATGPQGPAGAGAVESVNGETGVVVLDATDVGAEASLEYISQSLASTSSVNLVANKHYTFTKDFSGDANLLLPTTANDGDRVVVRRGGGQSSGDLFIVRQGGSPFLQNIGVLTQPNTVFYAVWSGLWRQDFIPPAGFEGRPSSATSTAIAGQMAFEDPYLYIAVSTNTWRRVPVAAF